MKKKLWKVGDPVQARYNPGPLSNWVGYIRRIDYVTKLAELAPECCIDSHLSIVRIDQLVATSFTSEKHRDLSGHIEHLRIADNAFVQKRAQEKKKKRKAKTRKKKRSIH